MTILDPADKTRLLAIEGLRRFVTDEESKYVGMLKKWKMELPVGAQLADPRLLAAALQAYLMMYDAKLASLMWSIFRTDDASSIQYYRIIAAYFVDREATM